MADSGVFMQRCSGVPNTCPHLTVSISNGRGITLALTLLHGAGSEGLWTLVRGLSSVRQTLHCPHLLAEAALGRTL